MTSLASIKPKPRIFVEKIGDREWELQEIELDIHTGVTLWSDNPRLQGRLPAGDITTEEQLEAALQTSPGYENLRRSIDDLGQMEPIYVKEIEGVTKALVLEGSTRVATLRALDRKYTSGIKHGRYRHVKAKLLPADFGDRDIAILLARIHVRGSGVRSWDRYIQAKFVFDAIVGGKDGMPLMNATQMANYMEKSVSFITRLRDAYEFAKAYVEHVDESDAERDALDKFSTLEEVSKARVIGSQLRDYDNANYNPLRADVFDMVRANAFKEYREARFLKDFFDDPDKWEQLKSGEPHVATRLSQELQTNTSSVKSKIAALGQQIGRSLDRSEHDLGDEEVALLVKAAEQIEHYVMPDVRPFRVALRKFTSSLEEVSMADAKALEPSEVEAFRAALDYFTELYDKHGKTA